VELVEIKIGLEDGEDEVLDFGEDLDSGKLTVDVGGINADKVFDVDVVVEAVEPTRYGEDGVDVGKLSAGVENISDTVLGVEDDDTVVVDDRDDNLGVFDGGVDDDDVLDVDESSMHETATSSSCPQSWTPQRL